MTIRLPLLFGLAVFLAVVVSHLPARALEAEKHTVYCADRRIEISTWDLAQMQVRRGQNVCAFSSFTSSSSATSFAEKNFGGQGKSCTCG